MAPLSIREASKYISVSYFKILIYIISLGLAYLTYRVLNKKEEVIEKNEEGKDE